MPAGGRARSPRRGRLSRSGDFDRVFRSGRSHAGRDLVLYVFPRGGEDVPRLGLSVSRKVGGAVERNRVKRLLREAFALEAPRLPQGTDAVVIARPGAGPLAEREGLRGIHAALRDLVSRLPGVDATETLHGARDPDEWGASQLRLEEAQAKLEGEEDAVEGEEGAAA